LSPKESTRSPSTLCKFELIVSQFLVVSKKYERICRKKLEISPDPKKGGVIKIISEGGGWWRSATAEDTNNLAVNVENPLGFSGIRPAKWERPANSLLFAS